MTQHRIATLLLTLLVFTNAAFAQAPTPPTPPELKVELATAHASMQPGGETTLAIRITVQEDWHAYHPIILDTGAPTTISFALPPGLAIGELQFPVPTPKEDHGLAYLSLDGTFTVLTTLSADDELTLDEYPITATVDALICKEACVPVEKTATLTLLVSDAEPAPANVELFEAAFAALPKPLATPPHLDESSAKLSKNQLGIGEQAELIVDIDIPENHHIQHRDPGTEMLIASRLFVEKINGIELGEQQWPKPHVKQTMVYGKVNELTGQATIRVPLEIIDDKFPSTPVAMRVLFEYQACEDNGACFPPEMVEGVVRFVAETPNPGPAGGTAIGNFIPAITLPAMTAASDGFDWMGLLFYLAGGFLGGLILNVMPCVFPVISIKVLSFVQQAGEDRGRVFRLGLAFCFGIMVWFWAFAILTSFGQIPWQYPPVAIGIAAILFVFALNLFGVFEIVLPGAAAQSLTEAASQEGYTGSFMKGLLATLMGTACTAPFFAGAAAWAATQPMIVALAVFTAAGLGMSSPYLLLSGFPGWLKLLPKPGPWMVTFKQAMAFILLATVIWLLLVIGDQIGTRGVVWTVSLFTFLGFAVWLVGKIKYSWSGGARTAAWGSAFAVALLGVWFNYFFAFDLQAAMAPGGAGAGGPARVASYESITPESVLAKLEDADWDDRIPWQPWAPGLPEALARRGYTVYVDFTATWCVTCQTNKATAVEIESTREKMKEMGVVPIKADWTRRNPEMAEVIYKYANSVPVNLVYPATRPSELIALPQLLTRGIVHEALDQAGSSEPITEPQEPKLAQTAP